MSKGLYKIKLFFIIKYNNIGNENVFKWFSDDFFKF